MSGTKLRRWSHFAEMLEGGDRDPSTARLGHLRGYQIDRPSMAFTGGAGSTKQLLWALENWVRPYLHRVRHGIDYDPKLHLMPTEPDWKKSRGRGDIMTRLKTPYGENWERDRPKPWLNEKRRRDRRAKAKVGKKARRSGYHLRKVND